MSDGISEKMKEKCAKAKAATDGREPSEGGHDARRSKRMRDEMTTRSANLCIVWCWMKCARDARINSKYNELCSLVLQRP